MNCKVTELKGSMYEVEGPTRTIILDWNEMKVIEDYLRKREWKAQIEDALDSYPEDPEDKDALIQRCLEEIEYRYEIHGEFNDDYNDVIDYCWEE